MRHLAKEMAGLIFGRLRVLERAGSIRGKATWLCACECGNTHVTTGDALRTGGARSCGCLNVESRIKIDGKARIKESEAVTFEEAHEALSYNSETGEFRWREGVRGRRPGSIAGNVQGKGTKTARIRVCLKGRSFMAHRLAWFMTYNEWPELEIDHIDRDPTNNRISNLRLATTDQNRRNLSLKSNNTSGFAGIRFIERLNKWEARACEKNKIKNLGLFPEIEHALEAREKYCRERWGDFYTQAKRE